MDQRNVELAKNLVNSSVSAKSGDKVLIECRGVDGIELLNCCIKEVYKIGAFPYFNVIPESVERNIQLSVSEEHASNLAKYDSARMDDMDCYIGIRSTSNSTEFSDVSSENMQIYSKNYSSPVHSQRRVPNTRWVVLRYPNASMAQFANTSIESFENYYYDVCLVDYKKMGVAMQPLIDLMNKTDKVRVTGKDTDITFSIKDIPAVACAGELNIPDGEIYTAPVKDSVNGVISYNVPSLYQGFTYENVKLVFENGKIVEATANNSEKINMVFDTDEGARFIGEFAIGVNPFILEPMKDTLFDEKIAGSIHFTPGNCYDTAYNGNKSAIHWDLVMIQREEYGGGEIYFDDVLVRKDGRFVLPELDCLNPENLK
ncbi:MAG: aminopeptidase [Lachnospirales bacterium]